MWWTNTLRTSAEDLGTLAENEPPTSYEPKDHFITEAYVEYTQESSGEQRFSDDFDYDDVNIGRRSSMRAEDEPITLKKACRPVCRRQSVMAERRDSLLLHLTHKFLMFKKLRDTTLKVKRIRTLQERQREQILADGHAEIREHEFQADY